MYVCKRGHVHRGAWVEKFEGLKCISKTNMRDSLKLRKMVVQDPDSKQLASLHPYFVTSFCDVQGNLESVKLREVYKQAGVKAPETDYPDDLLKSIKENLLLLNAYLEAIHGSAVHKVVTVPRSPQRRSLRRTTPKQRRGSASNGAGAASSVKPSTVKSKPA